MKKNFLLCLIVMMVVFTSNCSVYLFAASVTVGDYTLTVSKGSPASNPNSGVVYNNDSKNDVTTAFKISIEEETATGTEDVSGDVKTADYTVNFTGTQTSLQSCSPFWIGIARTSAYNSGSTTFRSQVSPVIRSKESGQKSVTLTVKIVMKDGTTLTASETITFNVLDYVVTLLTYSGNLPANRYTVYATNWAVLTAVVWGTDFGHAGWSIKVTDTSVLTTPGTPYVNKNIGFGCTTAGFLELVVTIGDYISTGGTAYGAGWLFNPDPTGFTKSKNFQVNLTEIESAITQTGAIKTGWSTYFVHSRNCTDAALSVAGAAGITLPSDCRRDVTFRNARGVRTNRATLPCELANHL